jgi:FKBP-type peptidyl-prolyl cis-trans isomerase FkpA
MGAIVTLARFASRLVAPAACALLLAGVAGCGSTTTGPSSTAPFSQVDLRIGTGAEAATGNFLTVNYTGWLYDPTRADLKGLQFDTSLGKDPFTFTLGGQQVIQGWDQGLVGMKVGGIRKLVIPPSLAYGGTRNNSIPPFATLVFEVELLDIPAPAAR